MPSSTLTEGDWDRLLRRIERGKGECTPLLGMSLGTLPSAAEFMRKLDEKYDYLKGDTSDLAHFTQLLAARHYPMYPKEQICEFIENVTPPNFEEPDEPHGLLAALPFPVYLTTNYDDFMFQALKRSKFRDPKWEQCRWNKKLQGHCSNFDDPKYDPTPANPLVFHLHGHKEAPESLVLTEDDYLDFLVSISLDQTILPARIQRAMKQTSLLFIGCSLTDWDFRVIFRGLVACQGQSSGRMGVTVQLPPDQKEMRDILDKYFEKCDMRIYWGTAQEFVAEFGERCKKKGLLHDS